MIGAKEEEIKSSGDAADAASPLLVYSRKGFREQRRIIWSYICAYYLFPVVEKHVELN